MWSKNRLDKASHINYLFHLYIEVPGGQEIAFFGVLLNVTD
jgi:hypothetical protein